MIERGFEVHKLPKEYIIVEIIPTHSRADEGFIAQLQALKVSDKRIVSRLDLRVNESLIDNLDLLKMINYDKEMFEYTEDKDEIMTKFMKFIERKPLLIIDNYYTKDYLAKIKNKKESVFSYLDMELDNEVFEKLINKYQLEPSNHLVDLLYEALMFEDSAREIK